MPIRDDNLVATMTSDGAMTADWNSSVIQLSGSPLMGLSLALVISAAGTSTVPTLTVLIKGDTTTAPTTASATLWTSAAIVPADVVGTQYIYPLHVPSHYQAIIVEYVLSGAATDSPSVTLDSWITLQVQEAWTRNVNWT